MIDSSKYVVLDVETNGLSSQFDDLLSISLYLPDKDLKFERFLPLYLNKSLNKEACKINGITKEMIKDKTHITQEEFDSIVEKFELYKREILHFGRLDKSFIKKYMENNHLKGFSKLTFHNIKTHFITNRFSNGEYSKDNLCNGLGIEGVKTVHSGINDCILEWKLFEKINGEYAFCWRIDDFKIGIYKLNKNYYVPASYFRYYPNFKYAVDFPALKATYEEVYKLDLTKDLMSGFLSLLYQPSGFASEQIIKSALNAKNIKDKTFAQMNFCKNEKIGEFIVVQPGSIEVSINDDGTLTATNDLYKPLVDTINREMLSIKSKIQPLINFIKHNIFKDKDIFSQETIINDDLKAFGYCDFSNSEASIEMKFGNQFYDINNDKINESKLDQHKYQYFITANGRPSFVLVGTYFTFRIYKVSFEIGEKEQKRFIKSQIDRDHCKIEMYDQNGKYIKTFDCFSDIEKELGITRLRVLDNCKCRTKLTHGYQFKIENTNKIIKPIVEELKYIHPTYGTKHVFQYDLEGKFINEYKSIKDAERITGVPSSKISMVCNGKRKQSGSFIWRYKSNNYQ